MGLNLETRPSPSPKGLCLLQKERGQADVESGEETRSAAEEGRSQGRRLLCALCGFPITAVDLRIRIQGSHVHTFANPHGYVYRIGCFLAAPGCLVDPRETTDFTWFTGYAWSVEVCGRCYTHMGWHFRSGVSGFHGLVLDRLAEEKDPPAADG